jgi:hypothetical protein
VVGRTPRLRTMASGATASGGHGPPLIRGCSNKESCSDRECHRGLYIYTLQEVLEEGLQQRPQEVLQQKLLKLAAQER